MRKITGKIKKLLNEWNEALRLSAPYISRWGGWYGLAPLGCCY